jgi:hypothetical protein
MRHDTSFGFEERKEKTKVSFAGRGWEGFFPEKTGEGHKLHPACLFTSTVLISSLGDRREESFQGRWLLIFSRSMVRKYISEAVGMEEPQSPGKALDANPGARTYHSSIISSLEGYGPLSLWASLFSW